MCLNVCTFEKRWLQTLLLRTSVSATRQRKERLELSMMVILPFYGLCRFWALGWAEVALFELVEGDVEASAKKVCNTKL